MAENDTLRHIIAEIKFRRGLKQSEVAEMLGIKPTYLSDMINGRVPYSDSMQKNISELFSDCFPVQVAAGDSNTQIAGNGNSVDSNAVNRALDEIAAHRALIERSLSLIEKKDAQIDRLIAFITKEAPSA